MTSLYWEKMAPRLFREPVWEKGKKRFCRMLPRGDYKTRTILSTASLVFSRVLKAVRRK